MNRAIKERIAQERPTDEVECLYWLIDSINLRRSCYWEPRHYEDRVRELGDLVTELFKKWLRAQGMIKDIAGYEYLVLPYISFRFFSAPPSKEVDIFTATSSQKNRLISHIVEDMKEIPDSRMFRAMMRESLNVFLSFLASIRRSRVQ